METFAGLKNRCVVEKDFTLQRGDAADEAADRQEDKVQREDAANEATDIPEDEIQSWYDECKTQRCESADLGASSWAGDTLRPERCFMHAFKMEEMRSELKGKWVVMSGGSNAHLSTMVFGNVIEPVRIPSPPTLMTLSGLEGSVPVLHGMQTIVSALLLQLWSDAGG